MSLYKAYLDDIKKRKEQGLKPKPIDDGLLIKELILQIIDVKNIGVGSDLCLNQSDSVVEWMRNGTWSRNKNYGEGSKNKSGFPKQPNWFEDARGFSNLEQGLKKIGFSDNEINGILGNNWYNFYKTF